MPLVFLDSSFFTWNAFCFIICHEWRYSLRKVVCGLTERKAAVKCQPVQLDFSPLPLRSLDSKEWKSTYSGKEAVQVEKLLGHEVINVDRIWRWVKNRGLPPQGTNHSINVECWLMLMTLGNVILGKSICTIFHIFPGVLRGSKSSR